MIPVVAGSSPVSHPTLTLILFPFSLRFRFLCHLAFFFSTRGSLAFTILDSIHCKYINMVSLETRLGYKFRNSLLLAEALTHPSLAYETQRPHFDNQRLEFLGDAVLELSLTSHLYDLFPGRTEGDLTKMRARLVSKHALFAFAQGLDLGSYMLLGKGEEISGGRERVSTLADAFEALIGAIYIDSGFDEAREIILKLIEPGLADIGEDPDRRNPKGRLQEILQGIVAESPIYTIIDESGPDHNKQFNVLVAWNGKDLAVGSGSNKKEAEAEAARNALKNKSWE